MRKTLMILCLLVAVAPNAVAINETLPEMKTMHLQTALVEDGEPAAFIACPDTEQYRALASQLNSALAERLGVSIPVIAAGQVEDSRLETQNCIALGLFPFNPVVEKLYIRELVACDYSWPEGEDSYVIRTVHNPWLTGTNVVFLGSAYDEGMQAAVERFIEIAADSAGVLDPIIEVKNADAPETPDEEGLKSIHGSIDTETSSRSMGGTVSLYCDRYFQTGEPAWAELFLHAMQKLDELQAEEGAADDVRSCRYIFMKWDRTEEGPGFSAEQRRELSDIFYRFAQRLKYANTTVKPSETPHGNNWNATGAAFAGIYFSRYYPDLQIGQTLMENMDTYYAPNMVNWKVNEDCPGYGNITLTGNYKWALHRPDRTYIENDCLKKMADYDMLITNNAGEVSGFGDARGIGGSYLVNAYPLAAWMYKDGRYLWWWDHFGGSPMRFWVPPEVLPREKPEDLLGVTRAPLAEWIYERDNYEKTRQFPRSQCFDKVSFRDGFDTDDAYMCLSGFCYGFHSHPDANAIVNYCDEDETRLYDDGYMIPTLREHNTCIIVKDGWAGTTPELAQVTAEADFDRVGMFESRLDDYNGVRWDRSVIWPKSRYFFVVDDLQAREPGQYAFQNIWRTLGNARLQGHRWISVKGTSAFNLIAPTDAALSQKQSAGTSLNAKPFPIDQARALIEAGGGQMKRGDSYQFANLFYTAPTEPGARRTEAWRISDTTWAIDDRGERAVAGIDRSTAIPGLVIEASTFHVTPDTITAARVDRIRMLGPLLKADGPVSLSLDIASGHAKIEAVRKATVTYEGPEGEKEETLEAGSHELQLQRLSESSRRLIADGINSAVEGARRAVGDEDKAGAEKGLRKLWAYTDFAVYRNFAMDAKTTLKVNRTHMEPGEAGYSVGDPPDMLHPGGNVMFHDGETVTIDITLAEPGAIEQVVVNSRQLKTFNGGCGAGKITVTVDGKPLGETTIDDPLQNAKVPYTIFPDEPVPGRHVKVVVEPYTPDHNVYIDSIELNGKGSRADIAASGFQINAMEVADVNADGRDETFAAGTDRTIHAVTADGTEMWKYPVPDAVNDLAAFEATEGGSYQIVAGCDDHKLYSINPDGTENFTLLPPPRTYARPGYRGVKPFTSRLTVVEDTDIEGDGEREIIVGSANWRCYLYNHDGQLRWDEVCWAHTPTAADACDLDGDNLREVVMGNSYTRAVVYSPDGKIIGSGGGSGHAGPTDLACVDTNNNGRGEIIVGDRAGKIWFQEWKGRSLPTYDTGADIAAVATADIDRDNMIETAVASKNYLLYLFDSDGKVIWLKNLYDTGMDIEIADIAGDESMELVVACADGTVKVFDVDGERVAQFAADGPFRHVSICELDGDPATAEIAAACDDGTIYGLQMPE